METESDSEYTIDELLRKADNISGHGEVITKRQAQALLLVDAGGLSQTDAADVLDMSQTTLREHLTSGRDKLEAARRLADEYGVFI